MKLLVILAIVFVGTDKILNRKKARNIRSSAISGQIDFGLNQSSKPARNKISLI
jgi:hypothetical protein